ncbi:hypothetical protein OROGR_001600 [Orobanche gracilis]
MRRSFSVCAAESATFVQAIKSSQRLFIERLEEQIDPSILSSPHASTGLTKALESFYSMKEKRVLPKIQFHEFIRHMETLSGMKPTIFPYNKGKNKLEAACVMFQTMTDVGLFRCGFSNSHFSFVMGKEGKLEEPTDLLPEMLELGLVPRSLTFDALIHGCATDRSHDMYKALGYKDEMICRGIKPSLFTYNLLLDALFERMYILEAEEVIKEMQKQGLKPDVHTYNIMISGYFKAKYVGESFIYKEMVENMIQPTLVTYNNLMLEYCRSCKMKEAQQLFDEMKAKGIKPNHISYNLLIAGYPESGYDMKEAFRVRDEMLKNGFHPTITTYKPLILGLSQNGEVEHAEELLREMVSRGICPPQSLTNVVQRKRKR